MIRVVEGVKEIKREPIVNARKIDQAESFQSVLQKQETNVMPMRSIFEKAASTYQVPVTLLSAVAKTESNYNPNAVSRSGAQGVMQLMPATADFLGVKDAFDPEQNIMGGAKYLSQLLERYEGDIQLALAAYNAGSGNVAKYGGIPPFNETQNYIKKVMAVMEENTDHIGEPKLQRETIQGAQFLVDSKKQGTPYSSYEVFAQKLQEQWQWKALQQALQSFENT